MINNTAQLADNAAQLAVQTAALIAQLNIHVAYASALMIALPAIAASIGVSLLGSKYLESVARQPEANSIMQSKMFALAGMIDGVAIISMGMGMILIFLNPYLSAMLKVVA